MNVKKAECLAYCIEVMTFNKRQEETHSKATNESKERHDLGQTLGKRDICEDKCSPSRREKKGRNNNQMGYRDEIEIREDVESFA
jgi:hypothetical protein